MSEKWYKIKWETGNSRDYYTVEYYNEDWESENKHCIPSK